MQATHLDESTDLANLRLRLRGGLSFDLQEYGGKRCYVIHDETSSSYFQIGIPEYAFLSVLDGNTTLQAAVQETSHRLGHEALTIRDAVRIGHWLIESGLANSVDGSGSQTNSASVLLERRKSQQQQKSVAQLNPLFIKLPLGNPQALIRLLSCFFGWLCSGFFLGIWVAVVMYAIVCVFQSPSELYAAGLGVFTADGWAWMLVTMIGLKVVHELAHGLFCDRFGGSVKETGLVFILFIPMPYVDVTSCWSFRSKWERIAVAAAGMYIEMFVAALAAIAWSFSGDPVLKFHLFNVMLLGSLTTLLFNANFLMRFDGYYMLADFLEIPNLYQKGQQFVNGLGSQFVLGMAGAPCLGGRKTQRIIQAYGLAALFWRVTICVSLAILATALFYGFGIALAIIGVIFWLGTPIWRFVSNWQDPSAGRKPNFKWIATVTVPAIACLALVMFSFPWPVRVSAPAIVEYESPALIRADASGFVKAVYVTEGQTVRRGDLLVELENQELKSRLSELKLERAKSVIRSRTFYQDREIATYQAENASRLAIDERINEVERKLSSLILTAISDGIVVASELETLPGQYVSPGAILLEVVNEDRKQIAVSVGQDDFEVFSANTSESAMFLPRHGRRHYSGILNLIEPTATSTADVRLTSYGGGRLAVRPPAADSENQSGPTSESLELVAARFNGEVQIGSTSSRELRAGTVGTIRLNQFDETIAEHVLVATRRWLKDSFNQLEK